MRFTALLVVCLSSVILTSELEAAGKRYALVVGVSTYHPAQPLPKLPYTENDANDLAQVLSSGGYKVKLMTNSVGRMEGSEVLSPISSFIRTQLDALLDNPNLTPDDIVIVALAGHGVQYELIDGDKKSAKFYFCPTDAEITSLETANQITDKNNILDLAEVYAALNQCKAGGKLLLVDACRNDPTKTGLNRSITSKTLPPIPPPPGGTAAFFSCSAHQQAFEDKDLKHGVFFHHVIQGLKGDADVGNAKRPADGQITLTELSGSVASATYDFVLEKYNAKQSPELKGEFRLSIPLLSIETKARFAESLGIELVPIPVGEFFMGSSDTDLKRLIALYPGEKKETFKDEQPRHKVRITKLAAMSAHEVTVGQFRKFVDETNYQTDAERDVKGGYGWNETKAEFEQQPEYTWKNPGFPQTDAHPVVLVSWNDAVAYCEWLTKKDGRVFRLPREAEWEYCARAESKELFPNGNDRSELVRIGNVGDSLAKAKLTKYTIFSFEAGNDGFVFTAPVGHYPANRFGLHDMLGNVWEWCGDGYDSEYYRKSATTDPSGDPKASFRVIRGGSWDNYGRNCRSARRDKYMPDNRHLSIGFRLVQVR